MVMFVLKKKKILNKMIELKNYWNDYHKALDQKLVSIGDYTYGMPQVITWDDSTKLKIGKFCSLASNIYILAGGEHRSDWVSTYPFNCLIEDFSFIKGHPATKGDIIIGNDVWIGDSTKILSGVTIGDGAIIGTGSVVAKDIPPYAIAAGNPARIIRYRFDDETIKELLDIKWWDFKEEDIIKIVPLLQSNNIQDLIKKCRKIKQKYKNNNN